MAKGFRYFVSEEKKDKALQLIIKNGGKVYTDNTFSISGVEGYYTFEDGIATIVITDKPFLASWSMIEEKLDDFFTN